MGSLRCPWSNARRTALDLVLVSGSETTWSGNVGAVVTAFFANLTGVHEDSAAGHSTCKARFSLQVRRLCLSPGRSHLAPHRVRLQRQALADQPPHVMSQRQLRAQPMSQVNAALKGLDYGCAALLCRRALRSRPRTCFGILNSQFPTSSPAPRYGYPELLKRMQVR